MRIHDTLSGLLLLGLGFAVAVAGWMFPSTSGQSIGPGLFPMITGVGLAGCGATLIYLGRARPGIVWVEFEDWVRIPRRVFNGALVVGALVFYALVVDIAGFFITAFVLLATLFAAFGVKRRWIAPAAVAVTLGLHGAFYSFLRVPLPWGWLEGLAW